MQNRTEAPRGTEPQIPVIVNSNTGLDFLFTLVLLSCFTHASRGHLPGKLPEPESLVSWLALWESPAKMSDALQGLWSGWR